jgi:phosphatidylglycerol---prolipoprotein diacylglyceryl transferase
MYPDFSYILHDLMDTPLDNSFAIFRTYGLIIVFDIILCMYLLKAKFIEKEKLETIPLVVERQILIYFLIFFNILMCLVLGFNFNSIISRINLSEKVIGVFYHNSAKIPVVVLAIGLIVSYFQYKFFMLKYMRKKTFVLSSQIYNLVAFIMLGSILGSIFLGFFEDGNLPNHSINYIEVFQKTNYYGGLIGGLIFGVIYFKFYKLPVFILFDSVAPILMLGYSIGRLACHFSGDGDWGIVNNSTKPTWIPHFLWGCNYPNNVLNEGVVIENMSCKYFHVLNNQVFPTSLYEFILALIGFFILFVNSSKTRTPYFITCLFLLILSIERFLIEFIRVNPKISILGFRLTQAQIISSMMLLISVIFFLQLFLKKKENRKREF